MLCFNTIQKYRNPIPSTYNDVTRSKTSILYRMHNLSKSSLLYNSLIYSQYKVSFLI